MSIVRIIETLDSIEAVGDSLLPRSTTDVRTALGQVPMLVVHVK